MPEWLPRFAAGGAVLLVGVALVSWALGDYLGERDARRAARRRRPREAAVRRLLDDPYDWIP